MFRRAKARRSRGFTSGQAMVEFLVVLPSFILLLFGSIQFALIFSAKTTLNYATFQAARIGSLNNATYSGIRKGLVRGLSPLFTASDSRDGPEVYADINEGVDSGGNKRDATSEVDAYVRIIRVSPGEALFSTSSSGFGELNEDGALVIPNHQLMYRDSDTKSNVSIQDANLLKIRVQYCYKLMVPIVNKIIGSLSELNNTRARSSYAMYETVNDPRFADLNRGYANEMSMGERALASYDDLCSGRGVGDNRGASREGFMISSEAIVRMQTPAFAEDENEVLGSYMCDGDRMACP